MRRAGRVVEMAAASHRRQQRLAIFIEGKAIRFAHDIHRELIGAAGDVRVKLDLRQEYRRDAAAVPVLAQTPRARSAEIRCGGQAIFRAGQNGAQGFLGVEVGTGRGTGLAEVRVNGLHPLKLVIGQFVVENREGRTIGHGRLLCLILLSYLLSGIVRIVSDFCLCVDRLVEVSRRPHRP